MTNLIDMRLYLTEAEFRTRVQESNAWASFRRLRPLPLFDEAKALADVENRNAMRRNGELPAVDATKEIARRKLIYDAQTYADRVRELANRCIVEIYGPVTSNDFNSLSAMRVFFASKQNVIRDLVNKQS